jgi:hypothetical protein
VCHFCARTVELLLARQPELSVHGLKVLGARLESLAQKKYTTKEEEAGTGRGSEGYFHDEFWNSKQQEALRNTATELTRTAQHLCKADSNMDACKALKEFGETWATYEAAEADYKAKLLKDKDYAKRSSDDAAKDAAYRDSPQYIQDRVCKVLSDQKFLEDRIATQKRAGAVSGFVDKRVLYESGMMIESSKQVLTYYQAEYRKKTGKALDLKKCK